MCDNWYGRQEIIVLGCIGCPRGCGANSADSDQGRHENSCRHSQCHEYLGDRRGTPAYFVGRFIYSSRRLRQTTVANVRLFVRSPVSGRCQRWSSVYGGAVRPLDACSAGCGVSNLSSLFLSKHCSLFGCRQVPLMGLQNVKSPWLGVGTLAV